MITYVGIDRRGTSRTGRVEKRPDFFAEEKFTAGWRQLTIRDGSGERLTGR